MSRSALLGLLLAAAVAAVGLVAPGGAGAAAAAPCPAGSLRYRVVRVEGAAGTFLIRLDVRPTARCTLRGYPSLRILGADGPLPTRVRHGGLAVLNAPVRAVVAAPGRPAVLLVAYNDVPGGSGRCARGVALRVGGVRVGVATRACRSTLLESPFLPGRG